MFSIKAQLTFLQRVDTNAASESLHGQIVRASLLLHVAARHQPAAMSRTMASPPTGERGTKNATKHHNFRAHRIDCAVRLLLRGSRPLLPDDGRLPAAEANSAGQPPSNASCKIQLA